MRFATSGIAVLLVSLARAAQSPLLTPALSDVNAGESRPDCPRPPAPEPIEVTQLPLPPTTVHEEEGGCSVELNPRRTGCIGQLPNLLGGNFLPDHKHVVAAVEFKGAPAAPDPASIYTGLQLILVKADGTTFANGDPWKCITCGVPEDQQIGRGPTMEYPQAFTDGTRVLAGTDIIDCAPWQLSSPECTPERTYIFPIRWNIQPDGSGPGGNIRELRKHPDDVHLGYNSMSFSGATISQFAYFARLQFNPSPTTGMPLAPRYDLVNVTRLHNPDSSSLVMADGDQIRMNYEAITVGELRGFSGRGNEVTYVGYPWESCNMDVFAVDLTTGKVRRLTSHPEYVDPVDISPDDQWVVVEDTRGTGRQMFLSAMRGIPPIIDMVVTGAVSSTRNNGQRRFFQPWMIDRYGDRGTYFGQQINAAGDGSPGSVNDPEWNARADPKWSLDGTRIVYSQQITLPPACGGINPLPCPISTEPGGRVERLMVAHLTSRPPIAWQPVAPVSDIVPWGVPYEPGSSASWPISVEERNYSMVGEVSGSAEIKIRQNREKTHIVSVAVIYHNFSNDGDNVIAGMEEVSVRYPTPTTVHLDWDSNLTSTGISYSTKMSSPDGFHLQIDMMTNILEANGTLTTNVDGITYLQPANGT
ncbi:putative saponin hydrolase protein [Coleophoma cylindrospora]|uniref:Putative saponin hydrolase protein n=1 Tax=Coleophoma cylindrospora TaxID=1849047 RepID=A0A3D8R6T0_9HELO|nr:putative saponin hydrolase protein [Coleophoma cylindrospora]